MISSIYFFLFCFLLMIDAYHIAIVSTCTSSLLTTKPLAYLLTKRGHDVTYVSPSQCSKHIESVGAVLYNKDSSWNVGLPSTYNNDRAKAFSWMSTATNETVDWLNSLSVTDRPDLIMTHAFQPFISSVADAFNIPFILLYNQGFPYLANITMISETVIQDAFFISYFSEGSFIWRSIVELQWYFYDSYGEYKSSFSYLNNYRVNILNIPQLSSYFKLLTQHPVFLFAGSPLIENKYSNPNVYTLGLLPLKQEEVLADDILSFMHNSDKPILYISTGSDFSLRGKILDVLVKYLNANSRYDVIWNFSDLKANLLNNLPENVFVKKNIPQRQLLASGRIDIFMTTAEFQSVLEAIEHQVPLIMYPQGRDQYIIAEKVEKNGLGISLPVNFNSAHLEVTLESFHPLSYRKAMSYYGKKWSKLMSEDKVEEIVVKYASTHASSRLQTYIEIPTYIVYKFYFLVTLFLLIFLVMLCVTCHALCFRKETAIFRQRRKTKTQ